jgi:hypothetical protein
MTTEKEWWFDDLLPAFSEDYAPDKPFLKECIKRIVQEQKKRDWEEFREMVESVADEKYPVYVDTYRAYRGRLKKKIDAKLAELNKPKE